MLRRSPTHPPQDLPSSRTVRVLRSDEELAQAWERAAAHARRLQDRLEVRAVRDAWSATHRVDDPAGRCGTAAEVAATRVVVAESSSPAA